MLNVDERKVAMSCEKSKDITDLGNCSLSSDCFYKGVKYRDENGEIKVGTGSCRCVAEGKRETCKNKNRCVSSDN